VNEEAVADPKRAVYERLSDVAKAIASGPRLELLDLLSQGEKTVETLALQSGLSVANASRHLQVLRDAGLARVRREGRYAHYRVSGSDVVRLVRAVRALGEKRLADLDGLLRALHPEDPEPLTLPALRERMERGEVVLLDVRPETEYTAGHLPTARSIPVGELEARIGELPADREVIAYCRGPYCRLSDEAVALLRRHGRSARRLRDGPADWRATRDDPRGASG
jgi:rhodanese-related sulfurtransferase/predicted transcriptional regulator